MRVLCLAHATVDDLLRDHDANLRKGRAFVAGEEACAEREVVALVVVHPETGETWSGEAECVYARAEDPGRGVGVQLSAFDEAARNALAAFVRGEAPKVEEPEPKEEPGAARGPRNVHERIRALSLRERETVARQGTLPERVALERTFGSSVWEGLLQNPQLTPPEVARIAKNGVLPRPLVQIIVANAAWIAIPEIQRSLLSNPRVAGAALERILRTMSHQDLSRVAAMTAYRHEVRQAAKRILGG